MTNSDAQGMLELEQVAKWLEDQSRIMTNSLHCGDNAITHKRANSFDMAAAALRAAASAPVQGVGEPVAWVIGRDNNANDRGFIDAMAWSEGEFTTPLFAHPSSDRPASAQEGAGEPILPASGTDEFDVHEDFMAEALKPDPSEAIPASENAHPAQGGVECPGA